MAVRPSPGKTILITGAAPRLGRVFALACARAGADVIIHHGNSEAEAEMLRTEANELGRRFWIVEVDLGELSKPRFDSFHRTLHSGPFSCQLRGSFQVTDLP